MFSADSELEARSGLPAILNGDSYEPSDTVSIEHLERIIGKDTTFDVGWQKPS